MQTESYIEEVISLCQELIQKTSLSGHEKNACEALQEYMIAQGVFDSIHRDEYGNILACINGKYAGPTVVFDGHIDTVPVQDETKWTYPPFAAEIHNDRIYGRGASIMGL